MKAPIGGFILSAHVPAQAIKDFKNLWTTGTAVRRPRLLAKCCIGVYGTVQKSEITNQTGNYQPDSKGA
jgi:hypothetical protein